MRLLLMPLLLLLLLLSLLSEIAQAVISVSEMAALLSPDSRHPIPDNTAKLLPPDNFTALTLPTNITTTPPPDNSTTSAPISHLLQSVLASSSTPDSIASLLLPSNFPALTLPDNFATLLLPGNITTVPLPDSPISMPDNITSSSFESMSDTLVRKERIAVPPSAGGTTDPPPPPPPEVSKGQTATRCVCPPGFQPLGENGCYHLLADGDHESIEVACESRGGKLMTITSPKEDSLVRSVMTKHWRAMAWIGLVDEGVSEPEWTWPDGSELSGYAGWHREPGSGQCVVTWLYGGWQRRDCRQPAPGLCYRPLTATPQECMPPPAPLPRRQFPPPGEEDKWKLVPPPPAVSLPKLSWPPPWVRQRFVLRDTPAQWHQWI